MKIIEVEHLHKKFGNFYAVDDINFSVEKGELFGFLGPNGAGKTTTIKILTTLLQPSGGWANVNGFDVIKQRDAVRASIGLVFQDPSLDEKLTARENLVFHGWLYDVHGKNLKNRIKTLLKLTELEDRTHDMVKNFSGGMKRRLEIARGLIHHPKIFFLDEPTLGLDPQTRNRIWEYLRHLNKKESVTIFLTTHYMDEAEFCDRIAIIDRGKIIAIGTPTELKKQTNKTTLNDVFLNLTGRAIREEEISDSERMKKSFARFGIKR